MIQLQMLLNGQIEYGKVQLLRPKDLLRCDLHEVVVTSNDD